MKSPTLNGLNSMIITPPAKFCKVPLKAMPIAKPAEANKATSELVLMPKMPTMAMMRKKVSKTEMRLITKELSEGSALRRSNILVRPFFTKLMTQRPRISTKIAATNLIPNGIRYSFTKSGSQSETGVVANFFTPCTTVLTAIVS